MQCSLFSATSIDEIIAKEDGNVDFLHTSGKTDVGMGEHFDIVFRAYFYSIDCMIMGEIAWI